MIHLPFFRFVTFTKVPKGSFRWAAVNSNISKSSPLAVVLPWNCLPYQDAVPTWSGFGSAFELFFVWFLADLSARGMALFFTWGCWWFGTGAAPTLAAIKQAAARM